MDEARIVEETNSDIIFSIASETPSEILRFSKGKFFYKGQEIDDVHQIYERFHEWMTKAEISRTSDGGFIAQ